MTHAGGWSTCLLTGRLNEPRSDMAIDRNLCAPKLQLTAVRMEALLSKLDRPRNLVIGRSPRPRMYGQVTPIVLSFWHANAVPFTPASH
jgi:hypothetical protein